MAGRACRRRPPDEAAGWPPRRRVSDQAARRSSSRSNMAWSDAVVAASSAKTIRAVPLLASRTVNGRDEPKPSRRSTPRSPACISGAAPIEAPPSDRSHTRAVWMPPPARSRRHGRSNWYRGARRKRGLVNGYRSARLPGKDMTRSVASLVLLPESAINPFHFLLFFRSVGLTTE